MIPEEIQKLKDAEKPCKITARWLHEIVRNNLGFLANHPLDVIGPGAFDTGLANLEKYLGCEFYHSGPDTYIILPV